MQIGKRQGEHHHHQAAERIENLAPEFDLVFLGGLTVGFQVANELEQGNRGHAIGLEQGAGDHGRSDLRWPLHLCFMLLGDAGLFTFLADLGEFCALQQPLVVLLVDLRCLGTNLAGDMAIGIEFEDAHIDKVAGSLDGSHVDGDGVISLLFLEPGARGPLDIWPLPRMRSFWL